MSHLCSVPAAPGTNAKESPFRAGVKLELYQAANFLRWWNTLPGDDGPEYLTVSPEAEKSRLAYLAGDQDDSDEPHDGPVDIQALGDDTTPATPPRVLEKVA